MPKLKSVGNWVHQGKYFSGRPDLISTTFPKSKDFIKIINAEKIFEENDDKRHTYAMTKEQD